MVENFSDRYFEKVNQWITNNIYNGTCSVFNTFVFLTYNDVQQVITILNQNGYRKVDQMVLSKSEWTNYRFVLDVAKDNIAASSESIREHISATLELLKDFDFENNKFAIIFQKSETESDYFDPFE